MPASQPTIERFPDADALAHAAAEVFRAAATAAVAERGWFTVALAGGSTPEKTYRALASAAFSREIPWDRVRVFLGDERFVPLTDDARSNYALARRTLLSLVPIPADNVWPVDTSLPTAADAAAAYAETLITEFGRNGGRLSRDGLPIFDLILLGLGDDGHTASLFPHAAALSASTQIAAASPPGTLPPPVDRITLTLPVLNAARAVAFLIAGANKAEALRDILESGPAVADRPAAGVKPVSGSLIFLVDAGAASLLKGDTLK